MPLKSFDHDIVTNKDIVDIKRICFVAIKWPCKFFFWKMVLYSQYEKIWYKERLP